MLALTETKSPRNPYLVGNLSCTNFCISLSKVFHEEQGKFCQASSSQKSFRLTLIRLYHGKQLIDGVNLVSPSLPSLGKAIPLVNTQPKIFSQAVKPTASASALGYIITRSFAVLLSSKLDWNELEQPPTKVDVCSSWSWHSQRIAGYCLEYNNSRVLRFLGVFRSRDLRPRFLFISHFFTGM